jgi:hypothetical protein
MHALPPLLPSQSLLSSSSSSLILLLLRRQIQRWSLQDLHLDLSTKEKEWKERMAVPIIVMVAASVNAIALCIGISRSPIPMPTETRDFLFSEPIILTLIFLFLYDWIIVSVQCEFVDFIDSCWRLQFTPPPSREKEFSLNLGLAKYFAAKYNACSTTFKSIGVLLLANVVLVFNYVSEEHLPIVLVFSALLFNSLSIFSIMWNNQSRVELAVYVSWLLEYCEEMEFEAQSDPASSLATSSAGSIVDSSANSKAVNS